MSCRPAGIFVGQTQNGMTEAEKQAKKNQFHPLVFGALYSGIDRGLKADVLAAGALGGSALPVCTAIIVASHGKVTEVLEVPTDSIDSQLGHLLELTRPDCVKIGIVGNAATAELIFRRLSKQFSGPIIFDVTLSGPSGEDLAGRQTVEVMREAMSMPDLVTLRRFDASRLTGMQIDSLDDAQVAVQRIKLMGARSILLRLGSLPGRFFEADETPPASSYDLFFDGNDFSLFEAPRQDGIQPYGASSVYLMALLSRLERNGNMIEAIQFAKSFVSEALRSAKARAIHDAADYFWKLRNEAQTGDRIVE